MSHTILIARSEIEKEAIFRFRYQVYIEEFHKNHLPADHAKKMLSDRADAYAILYYSIQNSELSATVRSQRGTEGPFTEDQYLFFDLKKFEPFIDFQKLAIVDRLIVAPAFRKSPLAHEMMKATYVGGLEVGTKICFVTCDDHLLPMYLRYGFMSYHSPIRLKDGQTRHRLLLLLCDKQRLLKVRSPFLLYLPDNTDDGGSYADLVQRLRFQESEREQPINQ